MTSYVYSIQNDTLNGRVVPDILEKEIYASAITVAIDHIDTSGDEIAIWFKLDLSEPELTILTGVVSAHEGIEVTAPITVVVSSGNVSTGLNKDSEGNLLTIDQKTTASSVFFISHNYCDPCTWFMESVRVSGELTWSGGLVISPHTYWIDLSHARFTSEESISTSYLPIIAVDGSVKTEGIDFTISYESGIIIPTGWSSGTVTAAYSYASGSAFTFPVTAGKKVKIADTEVQRSVNIAMNQHIIDFDILVNGVKVGGRAYKCYKDYLNVSNRAYPVIPAGGELTQDIQILRWDYPGAIYLKNSAYSIRCRIRSNQPFTGEMFTVTCYGTSESE